MNADGKEVAYDSFPSLVAAIQAGRVSTVRGSGWTVVR